MCYNEKGMNKREREITDLKQPLTYANVYSPLIVIHILTIPHLPDSVLESTFGRIRKINPHLMTVVTSFTTIPQNYDRFKLSRL